MTLYKEIIQVYMDSEYCNDILIFFRNNHGRLSQMNILSGIFLTEIFLQQSQGGNMLDEILFVLLDVLNS